MNKTCAHDTVFSTVHVCTHVRVCVCDILSASTGFASEQQYSLSICVHVVAHPACGNADGRTIGISQNNTGSLGISSEMERSCCVKSYALPVSQSPQYRAALVTTH